MYKKILLYLFMCALVVGALTLTGCSSEGSAAMSETAPGGISDHTEIMTLMDKDPGNLYLLDVRTPGEYSQGRIQGSVLIPMNSIQARLNEIPRNKKIIVVCATGARSGAVTNFLVQQGYPWVKNYGRGIVDWSRRGLPVVR